MSFEGWSLMRVGKEFVRQTLIGLGLKRASPTVTIEGERREPALKRQRGVSSTPRKDQPACAAPLSGKATPTNVQRQRTSATRPGGGHSDQGTPLGDGLPWGSGVPPPRESVPPRGGTSACFQFNTPAPEQEIGVHPFSFSGGPTLLSHSANPESSGHLHLAAASPAQNFVFDESTSGLSIRTPLSFIPHGLINPHQLNVCDDLAKSERATAGLQALRAKAVPQQHSFGSVGQNPASDDVVMVGESNMQSHTGSESPMRQAEEKKRQFHEKQRKVQELYEAEHRESLLVEKVQAETLAKEKSDENSELKTKMSHKDTELSHNEEEILSFKQKVDEELQQQLAATLVKSGPPTSLVLAKLGVDGNLLQKIQDHFHLEEVIVENYDLDITKEKIDAMRDGKWLNSEVIMWWLEWWRERTGGGSQKEMPKGIEGIGKNWFANTYFYSKLADEGYTYKNVKRWTKKIKIFECDKMIIPINKNKHWYLACINFKEKRTEVYDSMGGNHPEVHEMLMKWLKDEHQDKLGTALEEGWTRWIASDHGFDVPRQSNGLDCGVFACMFAACVSVNCEPPFDFKQADISFIRRWMVQVMYKEGERLKNCAHPGLCSM